MRVAGALLLCLGVAACGTATATVVERIAARELSCRPPALRVQATGELAVGPHGQSHILLYDAEGCEREQRYLCVDAREPRCATRVADLPVPADQHAGLERALRLLRTTARARCPESELRVVQESETLFRFHACDGAWLYHCRALGCERL